MIEPKLLIAIMTCCQLCGLSKKLSFMCLALVKYVNVVIYSISSSKHVGISSFHLYSCQTSFKVKAY